MGFSRSNQSTSVVPHLSFSAEVSTLNHCSEEDDDIKIKSLFYKMAWDFGLACFVPKISRRRFSDEENEEEENGVGNNLEHNKAWLLAESGGELNSTDPHSVHSSFRFSICSQVELESIKASTSSSATVLMVNLHNGKLDSKSGEISLKRIETLEKSISPVTHSLTRYTYAQIASATSNFTKGRVLGRGAWSCVFRGKVGGKKRATVAIKRLSSEDQESYKAFCRELMIASSLHHQHIVPLVGFCIDPEQGLFLVYKFVSRGSLEKYLHGKRKGVKGGSVLPWSVRYKVAVGIAEAIGYLHNGTERCIVHRDIKPSNILLSSRKSAKLCDFGLAAWTPAPSIPFLCKTVKGTFGYLAPEYFQHGKVSDKTDVYAFGVVLLELLTGRKPIETNRGSGEVNLVVWAKPLLQQGYTEKLLDPRIKLTGKHSDRIGQMVQAATACTHNEESRRPGIEEVIALLKGENPECISRKRNGLAGNNGCLSDRFTNWQLTKSDMKGHLALAMLGVTESDEDDHLYCI